ncbi:MAG: Ribosomal-protein-alanine acetyltransferase [Candidatus Roizmanbacteria bacterium GW2011_GWA2_35_19]|uniref:Ribosomal-protein-alanine acetyltransferase n=2 Tax=Candidatus Roizmaniibacteriota TaxID=1752723 RepID=A0A0G0F020_9BACT|nr:MAG: Ribosomal-protein-alanine acetyltransferase [Candidatus Roizmanbacteria bacterium GW2011_GWC2_35_12]KKP72702.1 MAG: Ribosomal-protein-alanine acetyltransferase [Candidatus Roizmanbacteria bacterium GW2011_GWA2_35_19]
MIKIIRRPLKESEVKSLIKDIRLYPDLVYVKESRFRKYNNAFIVEQNGEFVGLCGIYEMKDWVKLGPLVFLKKFHGKGYGKILLNKIVDDYSDKNIFITSSNIAVQKIISKLTFKEVSSYYNLPFSIILFLIKQLYEHIHLKMITEYFRKKFSMKRNVRKYYIKIRGG